MARSRRRQRAGPSSEDATRMLREHLEGFWKSYAVAASVRLGIVSSLSDQPLSASALARELNLNRGALVRLLRVLEDLGVVHRLKSTRRYEVTSAARSILSDDCGGGLATVARLVGERWYRDSWQNVENSIRSGQPGCRIAYGENVFDYIQQHSEARELLCSDIDRDTQQQALDLSEFLEGKMAIVDVGGGCGAALFPVLRADPSRCGTIFDLSVIAADVYRRVAFMDIASRCTFRGGNFLTDRVPGGDGMILKEVLHDWDDSNALKILQACRESIFADGTLLIVERILKDAGSPEIHYMDLAMLVLTGGKERTLHQYVNLLRRSGFRLRRTREVGREFTVLVAKPV